MKNRAAKLLKPLVLLVAHVAELADALDSGSLYTSWNHEETFGNKGACLDIYFVERDPFGLF